jgi:hypothetical protein
MNQVPAEHRTLPATQIRWNQLKLDLTGSFNVITKAPRHLILEEQLRPFLEIRWQPPAGRNEARHSSRILKDFEREIDRELQLLPVDSLPEKLRLNYQVQAFNWDGSPVAQVLLLTCSHCQTHILLRCYRDAFERLCRNPPILEGLRCHLLPGEGDWWHIADVSIMIPEGFVLESCSFRFGLSDLRFKHRATDLHLCRLAPASTHLKQHDFGTLFESFALAPQEDQQVIDAQSRCYRCSPKVGRRLLGRLRKRKGYCTASFKHYPRQDRIIGYSLRSSSPIDQTIETELQESYGIIEEEKGSTDTDP